MRLISAKSVKKTTFFPLIHFDVKDDLFSNKKKIFSRELQIKSGGKGVEKKETLLEKL